MTQTEKHEALGKACMDLMQTKKNIETLNATLLRYGRRWLAVSDLGQHIFEIGARFETASPFSLGERILSLAEGFKHAASQELPDPKSVMPLVDELAKELARAKELQAMMPGLF